MIKKRKSGCWLLNLFRSKKKKSSESTIIKSTSVTKVAKRKPAKKAAKKAAPKKVAKRKSVKKAAKRTTTRTGIPKAAQARKKTTKKRSR